MALAGLAHPDFGISAALGPSQAAPRQSAGPAANPRLLRILGVNPNPVEAGSFVAIQLSRPPKGALALLVDGIPVRYGRDEGASKEQGTQGEWLKFELPAPILPGTKVAIVASDAFGKGPGFESLGILPLRILDSEPREAAPGAAIRLALSVPHPLLPEARVTFSGMEVKVGRVADATMEVVVPRDLASGDRPEIVVEIGKSPSVPYHGFTVRTNAAPAGGLPITPTILIVGLALGILVGGGGLLLLRSRRPRLEPGFRSDALGKIEPSSGTRDAIAVPSALSSAGGAPLDLPDLTVPDDLLEACLQGECVLYAGAGLSAPAGLPLWGPLVRGLLDWASSAGLVDPTFGASLRSALERSTGTDRVADAIVDRAKAADRLEDLRLHLREVFVAPSVELPPVHRLLPLIGFGAVLTTNFDRLLESAYDIPPEGVLTPGNIEPLMSALHARRFFILKLYGDLDQPASVLVAPAQYEETILGDRPFTEFMQRLFFTRTILFLGASLQGIEAYLKGITFQQIPTRRHYAVVSVDEAGWEAEADLLERRYGIHVLPYAPTEGHPQVPAFIDRLAARVERARRLERGATPSSPSGSRKPIGQRAAEAPSLLQSIEVRNVGPFEEMKLDFDPGWTILLGDNGVGKSTILKALALAVAGRAAQESAGRLLRFGTKRGQIVIRTTSGRTYGTDIFVNAAGQAEVASIPARAFEEESRLVLGFPPARAIGAGRSKGPALAEGRNRPLVDDVLPILGNASDPRILDMKQWIVNLDYRSQKGGAGSAPRLLERFRETLGILLGETEIGLPHVLDRDVLVKTRDGDLPIDVLSQGTMSILGWVGILLQRLHEVARDGDQSALVLVDEIDAHMHPEWQQAIVARLKEIFPAIQFVVTTHSPFLAVGRVPGELVRLRRHPQSGKIVSERPPGDTKAMSVSDVLTSYLFGLESGLDYPMQKDLLRKRELSVQRELTAGERQELADLTERLKRVDVASISTDPLYPLFVQEMTRRHQEEFGEMRSLNQEEQERQRLFAREILEKLAGPSGRQA